MREQIEAALSDLPAPPELSECSNPRTSASEVLNVSDLLDRFADDLQVIVEIVEIYDSEVNPGIEKLRIAVESSDFDEVAKIAHGFKGMLANLSAQAGVSVSQALEESAKKEESQDLQAHLDQLIHELQWVKVCLECIASHAPQS